MGHHKGCAGRFDLNQYKINLETISNKSEENPIPCFASEAWKMPAETSRILVQGFACAGSTGQGGLRVKYTQRLRGLILSTALFFLYI